MQERSANGGQPLANGGILATAAQGFDGYACKTAEA
jgi:hypothetical protein